MNHPTTFFLLLSLLLAACSTSPATDEDLRGESQAPGPGLFSGDKGYISLDSVFSEKEKTVSKNRSGISGNDINIPSIDPQSFEDFESFKAWRRAQEPGSANYQEYQDWRAYQQYLRFKAQQGQVQPAEPSTPLK